METLSYLRTGLIVLALILTIIVHRQLSENNVADYPLSAKLRNFIKCYHFGFVLLTCFLIIPWIILGLILYYVLVFRIYIFFFPHIL